MVKINPPIFPIVHKIASMALIASLLLIVGCKKDDYTEILQPEPKRYLDKVFSEVTMTTVPYSADGTLFIDIFKPVETAPVNGRPVIVLAHGGAFIDGSKDLPDMRRLAQDFAQRGYVTASFSYRLGAGPQILLDSTATLGVVIRAVHDGMAAVRFLRKTYVEDGNPYGIDTSKIIGLGNSAGAVLLMHQAFMRNINDLPPHVVAALNAEGGLEGNRGHGIFASHLHAIVNLAGGINQVGWIQNNSIPICSAHGSADDVVPFNCGPVFENFPPLETRINLCGSNSIHSSIANLGFRQDLLVFQDAGHCPWITSNGTPTALMDNVERFVARFLYQEVL
jgi:para-nitrobenzyl esterase